MEPGMVRAAQPGSQSISRTRRARKVESGACATPGCTDDAAADGRFCRAHQAVLDRVRAELAEESASGKNQREMLNSSTRGMKGSPRKGTVEPAADDEADVVAEALSSRR